MTYFCLSYTFTNADGRPSWDECKIEAASIAEALNDLAHLVPAYALGRLTRLAIAYLSHAKPSQPAWVSLTCSIAVADFIRKHKK